ncbi:hypothetical protein I79_001151 [Cricetulus griseus]|uniref:Uncharacterized protein n=1 Tax=Cricetulus griseus TaxID=10029 RepID=G3GU06_CRIGR|nr:hypothetical protein I79_001151 [Cricetulus griseus]
MKHYVGSIKIHLVEADGAEAQWHQTNSHNILWSIFSLQQGNTSFEGSEESPGLFSSGSCTCHQ